MDQMYKRGNVLYLVPLEVPNHMPPDIRWQLGMFLSHFLNLIFPKIPHASLISCQDILYRLCLADGYQHAVRVYKGFFQLAKVFLNAHIVDFPSKIIRRQLRSTIAKGFNANDPRIEVSAG